MSERLENYTIAEGYELPSKGLIYKEEVNKNIELRSMTGRDELKRLSNSNTPFKALSDIIEGCMIEKPKIHVYDMCLGDYEFLLHKLRVISYGPEYKISAICPLCGNVIDSSIDLDTLEVKDFNMEEFDAIRTFTLPKTGKEITIKFQTPRMLDKISSEAKELSRKHKDSETDFNTLVTLTNAIESIDGNKVEPFKLEAFINQLPVKDFNTIRNHIDKLNDYVGLDTRFTLTCSSCGGEIPQRFRIGSEFFRPVEG